MSSPAALAALQKELVHGYDNLITFRMCNIAGLTLLVYDLLLTVDMEVRHFWKWETSGAVRPRGREHFSFLRILFFMNRYLPLATQILNVVGSVLVAAPLQTDGTQGRIWSQQILAFTAILEWFAVPACIVLYRTCALYGRNRQVIFGLVSFYLTAVVVTILIVVLTLRKYSVSAELAPGVNLNFHACHSVSPSQTLYTVFITPLIYDVTLCVVAVYALVDLRRRGTNSYLLQAMAQHTIAYCIVITIADSTNLIIYAAAESALRHVFDPLMFAIVSISCSRLLLHLREVGDRSGAEFFSEVSPEHELSVLRSMRAEHPGVVDRAFGGMYF
ncbi:hypothetical protein EXIGLDRAFT_732105 [Exidia glandulosa HHB12029]|uniref:DUF6533 domain-containing protein n=1 Tax=Exidia glandulosa HHB12029 TaxID=1314781 RepID=A0A165BMN3_EXIGL|nr:hypothetical protein EXIGLDRAFT_732105 [Exidia glandulosa HHB12029]